MKQRLLIHLVVLSLWLLANSGASAVFAQGPKLVISSNEYRLTTREGGWTMFYFSITNEGESPLVIKEKQSPEYISLYPSTWTISPGETKTIRDSYPSHRTGKVRCKMVFETNDPDQSELTLWVKGKIKKRKKNRAEGPPANTIRAPNNNQ